MKKLFQMIFISNIVFASTYFQDLSGLRDKLVKKVQIVVDNKYLTKNLNNYFHKENSKLDLDFINSSLKLLYLSGRFADIAINVDILNDKEIVLIYKLEAVKRIHKVIFRGELEFSPLDLNIKVALKEGEIFDDATISEAKARIRALYLAEGFPNVTIESSVSWVKTNRYLIVFSINTGKPEVVKSIQISGTPEKEIQGIRELIKLKAGLRYSLKAAIKDKERIAKHLQDRHYLLAKIHDPVFANGNLIWNFIGGEQGEIIFRASDPFDLNLFSDTSYDINDLRKFLNLDKYTVLDEYSINSIRRDLVSFYQEKSFLDCEVTWVTDTL